MKAGLITPFLLQHELLAGQIKNIFTVIMSTKPCTSNPSVAAVDPDRLSHRHVGIRWDISKLRDANG